tara:strand:+ start:439 stop:855 length:417 start_codon:yes stop_codon:yes gene_type:complete
MEVSIMAYMNKSKSDEWLTPKSVYDKLNEEFNFDFDPCPYPHPDWDGLEIEWGKSNYVNPPYSNLKQWIKKSYEEHVKGKTIVMLIPARTDTIAFHEYIFPYAEVRFLRGRIKFEKPDGSKPFAAPFPSCVVIWRHNE